MVDNFLADCAQQEGATADDIKYLKERNMPTSKGQMCMVACVGESLSLVNVVPSNGRSKKSKKKSFDSVLLFFTYAQQLNNGRAEVENSIRMIGEMIGAENPKMAAVKEIAIECGEISLPERCESSSSVYKCAKDGSEKRGFNLKDFL